MLFRKLFRKVFVRAFHCDPVNAFACFFKCSPKLHVTTNFNLHQSKKNFCLSRHFGFAAGHQQPRDWLRTKALTNHSRDATALKVARTHVNTTAICNRICTVPCKQAVQVQNSSVQKFVRTRVNGASEWDSNPGPTDWKSNTLTTRVTLSP